MQVILAQAHTRKKFLHFLCNMIGHGSSQSLPSYLSHPDLEEIISAMFSVRSSSWPNLHSHDKTQLPLFRRMGNGSVMSLRRMGDGIIISNTRQDLDTSTVHLPLGCQMIKFRWTVSGELSEYDLAVDIGNLFNDAQEMLSIYYNRRIFIHSPSGLPMDPRSHIISAVKNMQTEVFSISCRSDIDFTKFRRLRQFSFENPLFYSARVPLCQLIADAN
jgi:hypothetical protein